MSCFVLVVLSNVSSQVFRQQQQGNIFEFCAAFPGSLAVHLRITVPHETEEKAVLGEQSLSFLNCKT